MYAQTNKRVKTDKRDARALADALRLKAYQPAHRKSDLARRLHGLLLARAQLVRKRTSYVTFVRAQCERDGVILPGARAANFERAIERVHIETQLFEIISPILVMIGALNAQIEECDEELVREAKSPVASLLQTAPGVGPITALAFIAAIDDPKRFESPRQVSAYLGLVPGERNSGDSVRLPGAITKAGDRLARSYLVEAGFVLMMRNAPATPLKDWALHVSRRGGKVVKKHAAVAAARRLARILWAMWRDNKPFLASRNASTILAAPTTVAA
jgi:transposase